MAYNKRRSQDEWQALLEQQQTSGLSGPRFCKEHDISYASFNAWKRRLQKRDENPATVRSRSDPAGFIDLSQFSSPSNNGWRITLKLGNGVELELSQL